MPGPAEDIQAQPPTVTEQAPTESQPQVESAPVVETQNNGPATGILTGNSVSETPIAGQIIVDARGTTRDVPAAAVGDAPTQAPSAPTQSEVSQPVEPVESTEKKEFDPRVELDQLLAEKNALAEAAKLNPNGAAAKAVEEINANINRLTKPPEILPQDQAAAESLTPEQRRDFFYEATQQVEISNEVLRITDEYFKLYRQGRDPQYDIDDPKVQEQIKALATQNVTEKLAAKDPDETSAQEYLGEVMDEEHQEQFWDEVRVVFGDWVTEGFKSSSMTDFIDALFGYADFRAGLNASGWNSERGQDTEKLSDLTRTEFRIKINLKEEDSPIVRKQKFMFLLIQMSQDEGLSVDSVKKLNYNQRWEDAEVKEHTKAVYDAILVAGRDVATLALKLALKKGSTTELQFKELGDKRMSDSLAALFKELGKEGKQSTFESIFGKVEATTNPVIQFPAQPASATQDLSQAA